MPPVSTLSALLAEHTDLPIAFTGIGFASGAGRAGVNASTEPEQRRFLQRLLDDAFNMQTPLLIWFAAEDLGFAASPPYDLLSSIGLRDANGTPKESWTVWEEASNRPLDPEAAAALLAERGTPTATPLADEGTSTPTPTPTDTETPEGTPTEAASGG